MNKVGVTGGIGSGKTYVCKCFQQWFDTPVYYTDDEARRLMETDSDLVEKIIDAFGDQAYVNGKLNREYMRGVVFSDKLKLELLNALVHPVVHKDLAAWFKAQDHAGQPYAMVESAILFEGGLNKTLDHTIVVTAQIDVRLDRIIRRDHCQMSEALAKIEAQMPQEQKEKLADFLINNNGAGPNTKYLKELNKKFGGKVDRLGDYDFGW